MAKQYGFYLEVDKCAECHACEVACKAANNVDLGVRWRRVTTVWSGTFPNVTKESISLSCMHCGNPACEAVCPAGAIKKDPETGVVRVDRSKCIGCHYCFFACPFGVPQYGDDGTMQKCELCIDKLAAGQDPACVSTCPAGALHAGTLEELAALAQEKAAKTLTSSTQPSVLFSK
ncbi:MAG: 4Fe-4S dicluster domain-containing protein [Anaerolineae bacterium]|jgi:anaerobic dimethyl sulfoxide reductase subunit B (iron-sulfur subunit)|nr:4Fe-4S dicluster domain-containing protein [Anaerolineae bacterium]